GLDAEYWPPKVTQILGIEYREALQHLEYEDYLRLEGEVRHPWEKKALQKLLNIANDKTPTKEVQKEYLEKTNKIEEEAKQALKYLIKMLNSRSHSQDALREKAETLWQAMEIPKEFWEFSSSAAESTFTKSMEQLGFSMSVSAKSSLWGINLGGSVDHSSSSQSEDAHQSHSEKSYFCITKYQYIPLASCYFQRDQLRLSDAALRELQDMEQLLSLPQEDKAPLLNRCEMFWSRFGSHVNHGPLHFGGIFWWKASTEGFRAKQREEMKRQTSEVLNSLVRKSYGDFLASAGGALEISNSNSKASLLGRAREHSHTGIQVSMVNTGGPADTASLPQWKTGLVSDNTTWCVIDRGFELIPVWDIILYNHCGDFKSVDQMSRALRAAYKALINQGIGITFGEELGSAVQEARDFMGTVKAWEVTKVDERKLRRLMELKDDLNAKTRNPSVWINVCLSDKALQDFLVNTVRTCQESHPENTTSIKAMLRSLLDPHIYSVKDFP
ncbi:GVIN1 GTPase, partial [Cardinalis cardinalis]|nr:GVIN1 GTPase [Cardinalis cardinalis]